MYSVMFTDNNNEHHCAATVFSVLTGLLIICAGPHLRLCLNSTHEFDKVRAMKSIDLVTSPAYSNIVRDRK